MRKLIYNARTKEYAEIEMTTAEIAEMTAQNETHNNQIEIVSLKSQLAKAKEDVEQVDLFGMVRDDYSEKKILCASLINQIRVLEGKEPRMVGVDNGN